jgi:hypothetical protein
MRHLTRRGTYRGITVFSIVFVGYYIKDRQCTYDVTLKRVRGTILAFEKAIIFVYDECTSVAAVMQHARPMRRMVIGDLYGCKKLFHIINKGHDIREKNMGYKMCVKFSVQSLSATFLPLRRPERDMTKNGYYFPCGVCVVLVRF